MQLSINSGLAAPSHETPPVVSCYGELTASCTVRSPVVDTDQYPVPFSSKVHSFSALCEALTPSVGKTRPNSNLTGLCEWLKIMQTADVYSKNQDNTSSQL